METVVQFLRRDAVLRKQVSGELDPRSPFMDLHFGFGCSRIFVRYECLGKALWAAMHRRPEWIGGRNPKLLLLQQVMRRMTAPIPY